MSAWDKPPHDTSSRFTAVSSFAKPTPLKPYDLIPAEVFWRERYSYLQKAGYCLRPRYAPKWEPSWNGKNMSPLHCEDSIMLIDHQVIDARRQDDDKLVAIKTFRRTGHELQVAQYLSSVEDSMNHSVPIYDVLPDPYDARRSLLVMPFLRRFNNPEYNTVGEVIEFVDQMIDGLVFLHRHRIAHRDISAPNIMMDAQPLYPGGYHPVRQNYSPDSLHRVTALPRQGLSVKYYYIDFGLSIQIPEGASPFVIGDVGRDTEVPEISSEVPYDAFKVDIYSLGNVISKQFEQRYNSMEFLLPLLEPMKRVKPSSRPTAEEVLEQWQGIRADLDEKLFRWRLGPKSEPAIERMFKNTVAVAWESMYRFTRYMT